MRIRSTICRMSSLVLIVSSSNGLVWLLVVDDSAYDETNEARCGDEVPDHSSQQLSLVPDVRFGSGSRTSAGGAGNGSNMTGEATAVLDPGREVGVN